MDKESLLTKVHDAHQMSVCAQWMEPLFQQQETQVLAKLKALFRTGNYTEQILACHIAQLTAVEDLRNLMRGISRAGDAAAEEINEPQEEYDPYGI
jgi:hypothetical protein